MVQENKAELERLLVAEQKRLEENREFLGHDALEQCQHLEDAYDFLVRSYAGLETDELQTVLMQFIAGSKLQVATGFATLLRGQEADSRSILRKAIEHGLFAVNLFERPASANKWLYISRSQQAYKEYREEFNIMDLLHLSTYETVSGVERDIVACLIDRYELCCLNVHATPWAQGTRVSTVSPDGKLGLWMYLIDQISQPQLLSRFFFDADTHAQILMLFGGLAQRTLASFDAAAWYGRINELIANQARSNAKFESVMDKLPSSNVGQTFWQVNKPNRTKTMRKKKPNQF